MPKINQKVVSETPLILPEAQEQAEIVRLLDDLLAKEQQAKEAAEGVLEQIDLIKKLSSPALSAASWAPMTPVRRAQ